MFFFQSTTIEQYRIEASEIAKCYGAKHLIFENPNVDSWNAVLHSSKLSDDYSLYAEASFEWMRLWKNGLSFRKRILYNVFELICGYGLKPLRTVFTSIFIIAFFTFAFYLISNGCLASGITDICIKNFENVRVTNIFDHIYFSIVTFSTLGYGDMRPEGMVIKLLANLESLLGISMMGLFIFSLGKRYGAFT